MPEPSYNPTSPIGSRGAKINQREKEDAFLLYTIFCGDPVKTAHALDVTVASIISLAREEGWDDKVGQLAELRKSDKPGDLERAINRAVNFAQAHRMRQELERAVAMVQRWSDTELKDMLVVTIVNKAGLTTTQFSTRPLADLTSALEKAHTLTYLALGDTAQDRSRRKEESDDSILAASAMHAQIAKAMSEIALKESPESQLLEEQLRQADIVKNKKKEGSSTELNVPPLEGKKDEGTI